MKFMKYITIDDERKSHLLGLLNWLVKEVRSAGGDGDALWYSRYYNVNDILSLVKEVNDTFSHKWVIEFNENDKSILWGIDQEWIIITNNESDYKSAPSWQQCIVVN